ncbi:MAG: TRAP transporter substrate-binding protein [Comamonadaceae bacterium]|jgi:tripartite ATP-independent transporter DctP family solute receptor|nr:TRAP transporter substrate-binding protein [Comamonadaceae bacterium]
MHRRTFIGAVAAGSLASGAQAQSTSLRLASFANEASSWGRAQEVFKAEVEKRSSGRLIVNIFNNSTLGSNREALELARRGGVDFVLTGVSHATRTVPQLNALVFPYLFKNRDSMFASLDGEPGRRLNALMVEQGLSSVGWWDNGFRHVSNNRKPIVEPGDIQGLKLRTLPTPIHVSFFRKIGAVPTAMDFSELLPALRQGVIDGQENPPAVMRPFKIYEVQKFYTLTAHVNEPMMLVLSEQSRKRLSAEQQSIITAAAAEATRFQRQLNAQEEVQHMEALRRDMQVNEPPAATIAAFRQAAQAVYGEAIGTLGPGGAEIVRALVAANT